MPHPLPVLCGQTKKGSGTADEDPRSRRFLNANENPLCIVNMVCGLLEEVPHRLLGKAGGEICYQCALGLNA